MDREGTSRFVEVGLCWWVLVFFVCGTVVTLKQGEFRWRGGPVLRRAEKPVQYWIWTSIILVATLFVLMITITRTFAAGS
jgi:hypothetical protein